MRILHWLELWWRNVGGPVRSVTDLAAAMRRRGHEVLIATADPRDAPPAWLESPEPRMVAIHGGTLGRLSREGRMQVRELLQSVDCVHLHGVWERSTNQIAREASAAGVPYIQSLRGMLDYAAMAYHPIRKRLFLAAVAGQTLREAAAIHCTASGEASQAQRWIHREPLVIPNLLDLRELLSLERRESADPRILYLGRIHPTKGLAILVEAVAVLAARGLRVAVDVAGEGEPSYIESIRALVRRHRLEDAVCLHGHADDATRTTLLSQAWMLASPTEKENFGNALFESLAAGVPVVATRGLDAEAELEASGGTCLVDRNAECFAHAIERLVRDSAERGRLGESARQWSEAHMHPDLVASRFEQAYRRIAAR